jgi:hypothetical protein
MLPMRGHAVLAVVEDPDHAGAVALLLHQALDQALPELAGTEDRHVPHQVAAARPPCDQAGDGDARCEQQHKAGEVPGERPAPVLRFLADEQPAAEDDGDDDRPRERHLAHLARQQAQAVDRAEKRALHDVRRHQRAGNRGNRGVARVDRPQIEAQHHMREQCGKSRERDIAPAHDAQQDRLGDLLRLGRIDERLAGELRPRDVGRGHGALDRNHPLPPSC